MTAFIEDFRKMVGWCPNSGAIEARKSVQFDDMMVNARGGGGELTQIAARWSYKYRNIVLMQALFMSGISIFFFILWGRYESDFILKGIIYGTIIGISNIIFEWRRMNKAATVYFKTLHKTRMNKYISLIIFVFIVVGAIYALIFTKIDLKNFSSFFWGFSLSFWAVYFLVLFWERKNRKILFQHGASLYAEDIGATIQEVKGIDMMVNAPDGDRELTYITIIWWNKYHNRILLNSSQITISSSGMSMLSYWVSLLFHGHSKQGFI